MRYTRTSHLFLQRRSEVSSGPKTPKVDPKTQFRTSRPKLPKLPSTDCAASACRHGLNAVYRPQRRVAMALVDSGKPLGVNVGDFFSSLFLRLVVWVVVHSVHSVHTVTTILYRSTVGKVSLGGANYAHPAHFSPGGCTHERPATSPESCQHGTQQTAGYSPCAFPQVLIQNATPSVTRLDKPVL